MRLEAAYQADLQALAPQAPRHAKRRFRANMTVERDDVCGRLS